MKEALDTANVPPQHDLKLRRITQGWETRGVRTTPTDYVYAPLGYVHSP